MDDEARARAVLAEMQARISRGPGPAFALEEAGVTPAAVRAAFLTLTKQFHPARFGRMSTEIQRLSNEVFLGIKAAHELLLKSVGGGGGARDGASRTPTRVGSPPLRAASPPPGARPVTPASGLAAASASGSGPVDARTVTPTRPGIAVPSPQRPGTPPQTPAASASPPPSSRASTPASRAASPPAASPPAASPPERLSARMSPARMPPAPMPNDPPTTRGTGDWQQLQRTTPVFDERVELQQVLDALGRKDWAAAKTLLNGLAARVPTAKQYRALLAYTRAREAQAAGRGEDAVMELQRALQLDPELQQAKSAMAELLRRR